MDFLFKNHNTCNYKETVTQFDTKIMVIRTNSALE